MAILMTGKGVSRMKRIIALMIVMTGQYAIGQYYTPAPPPDFQAAGDRVVAGLQMLADQQRAEEQQRRLDEQRLNEVQQSIRQSELETQRVIREQERERRAADSAAAYQLMELRRQEQELRLLELQNQLKELELQEMKKAAEYE